MKKNIYIDPKVSFPLTVVFEDGSAEQYESIVDLEQNLEFYDSRKDTECKIFDSRNQEVFLILKNLMVEKLVHSNSTIETNFTSHEHDMNTKNLHIYYATIDVRFKKRLYAIDGKKRLKKNHIVGFMQEFGCTAESIEQMKSDVIASLNQSNVRNANVVFDTVSEFDYGNVEKDIYEDEDFKDALKGDPRERGIWYKTGRAFYWPDKPKWLVYSLVAATLVALAFVCLFSIRFFIK